MPLPSSGQLSLNDIQTEFDGTNPINLSEYYGVAVGIPSSGTIAISDFYGASNGPEKGIYMGSRSSATPIVYYNEIEGVTYATETKYDPTAALGSPYQIPEGTSSSTTATYEWGSWYAYTYNSNMQRFTYATEVNTTNAHTITGNQGLWEANNTPTKGYRMYYVSTTYGGIGANRFTYATETESASGTLAEYVAPTVTTAYSGRKATATEGYQFGGLAGFLGYNTEIMAFSFSTETKVPKGGAGMFTGACATDGAKILTFCGGHPLGSLPSPTSEIRKYTISSEALSGVLANANAAKSNIGSINSLDAGYFMGGDGGGSTDIEKMLFSNDTRSTMGFTIKYSAGFVAGGQPTLGTAT